MADTKKIFDLIKEHDVKYVDFRFTDPRGKWQHTAQPVHTIDESVFVDGVMFDGSSIAGWKDIAASDMCLMPDSESACIDPFAAQTQLILFCDAIEPTTGQPYERDPRSTARRAEAYLKESGIGDTAVFGPELEFFVFDDVRFNVSMNNTFYSIDEEEGPYNTGRDLRSRQRGPPAGDQGRLLPGAAGRFHAGSSRRDADGDEGHGGRGREAPPRGRAQPERARRQVRLADPHGRRGADLQVRGPQRRALIRQDRDLHAEADLRRQRLGHACAPVGVEGRQAAVRRVELRRPVGVRAVLHRRHHQARPRDQRLHQPDDQQLQAADPGLRGAGAARLLGAQPLGVVPHPLRRRARRASASRCASPTRPRTPISPSPPC